MGGCGLPSVLSRGQPPAAGDRAGGRSDRIDVVVHAFELHPGTPDEVMDNSSVLSQMMGLPVDQVEKGEERFAAMARADGLPFEVRRKHRNTRSIHRVLKLADEYDVAAELFSSLQRGAFSGDERAFDHEYLVDAAVALGVPADRVRDTLDGEEYGAEVDADRAEAVALGARGVPFAVFDGRFAVPGAATIAGYLSAIDQAFPNAPTR